MQVGTSTKQAAPAQEQLAVASRSDDNTANRGSARTPENDILTTQSSELADAAAHAPIDLPTTTTVAPTTTTVAPTTTTVAPTTTTVKRVTTTTAKPVTTTTAASAPATPGAADTGVTGDDVWSKLAKCEAGGRNDLGAPYYGYFQFSAGTWTSLGGTGLPSDHTYDEQKAMAQKLQARSGWGQWPVCSKQIGAA